MKAYVWKIKGWLISRLLFNALYILVIAAIPYIIKLALDYDYSKGYIGIVNLLLMYLGIAIFGMIFQYLSQFSAWKVDQKFFLLIKNDLFSAITRQNNTDFKKKGISEYVSILNNDVSTLQEYIESIIVIIESLTQILIYAFYLIALDYHVALVIIFSSALCLFLPNVTGKKLSNKRKIFLNSIGKYMEKITDLLSGFPSINLLTKKSFKNEQYKSLSKMENERFTYGKFRAFTIVFNGFFMYLLDIIAFSAVVLSLLFQTITIGTAAALLSYIKEFTFPIRSLISAISSMKSTKAVKTGIFSILSYKEKETIQIIKFDESIDFKHVEISWDNFQLDDFTYSFKKGKKYAIIGHSGSGKSTLFHLLMQQEYPTSGYISIDENPINSIEYSSIMTYVSQKEHIFKENFKNNVTVFDSYIKKSIKEIISFTESERIQSLENKEDCSGLSGGEKNLLAIVKMLIMDKEIILLDEPFAALDVLNKNLLQRKLYTNSSKTIIAITHDITHECLQYFDEILIMENGKLIYSGTKDEVLASKEYVQLSKN